MKSLEIFSGAGGLAKGIELAGFNHARLIEHNKDACTSLRKNFNPAIVYEADIKEVDLRKLEFTDIVAGGPPCQPFSLGGKHKAHRDSRDMFPYAIECIKNIQPKAFIFENVKGLLRPSFAHYFEYIILQLTYPYVQLKNKEMWVEHYRRLKQANKNTYGDAKYSVQFKMVNSANYGVPQKRERVIIVGLRQDVKNSWEFPVSTHSEDRLNWEKYVTFEYWDRHNVSHLHSNDVKSRLEKKYAFCPPNSKPWQTIRDALKDVPHPKSNHAIHDHIFKDGAKIYSGHTGSDIDLPSKTIKAGDHGVPGGENMIRYTDGTVRYFTTYEAKLIQSFPEDYIISGSWGESLRQIGNAVPVTLSKIIAQSVYTSLDQ